MEKHKKIFIAGAGTIGKATGVLLREKGDLEPHLFIGDAVPGKARASADWICKGSTKQGDVVPFQMPEEGSSPELEEILQKSHILLDCLPGKQAPRMAELAQKHNLHYANLTEYVEETNKIKEIAEGAKKGFLLQTGLAPGYINVLAHKLFDRFCEKHNVKIVETLSMRVGALTATANPPHYYGFTWSSIGVATEYLEPTIVIRDFKRIHLESLSERKTVIIKGVVYEEDLTSGGAADLPEFLEGKVRNLDYKTLRYPGHYDWIKELIKKAPPGEKQDTYLESEMKNVVPFVEDDLVVLYAAAEGRDANNALHREEVTRIIRPTTIGAQTLTAIQATTAAALAESAHLLLTERYEGVVPQSKIDPDRFLDGPYVNGVYDREASH